MKDLPSWTNARAEAEAGAGNNIRLVSKRNMQSANGAALAFPIAPDRSDLLFLSCFVLWCVCVCDFQAALNTPIYSILASSFNPSKVATKF